MPFSFRGKLQELWQQLVELHNGIILDFHTNVAFLCKKLYANWRKIWTKLFYWIASSWLSQNRLVLLSSSPDDKFGNISALAKKLTEKDMPFIRLNKNELSTHFFGSIISLARARVLVIDAESPSARIKLHRNTCLIHCWHAGGAYKKVAFDAKRKGYDDRYEEKRIGRIHRGISYFVCTSEETARIYTKAFRLNHDQMLVFGSPRLDRILCRSLPSTPSTYTILYAPTYRTEGKNVRYLPSLPDAMVLRTALVSRLGEDVRFVFRGHPTAPVSKNLRGWEDWSHLPQDEALSCASVLITDYSSIFFDFLVFSRPIVFYVPDFSNYQCHERELYFSPYEVFPDTTCSDEHTLLKILQYCRHAQVDYKGVWQKHMSACDGKSTERLYMFIHTIMKREVQ